MSLVEQLLEIEEQFAAGPGEPYRRCLADDALVIVPGSIMDREECAAAMDQSPGWDSWEIEDPRVISIDAESAILAYRWRSSRGDQSYEAVMSTVYTRRGDGWWVVLHQQTPQPG